MKVCLDCKVDISELHRNSKRCPGCAKNRRKRPLGTMTEDQKKKALSLIGKMSREDIAQKLGVSVPNLKRSLRGVSIWFHNGKYKNNPELVKKVVSYYEKHGMPKAVKKFPKVNVKAIVDRPEYYGIKRKYRQLKWTDDQLHELVKMGGIISMDAQAKYFNRPRANAGSIKSAWMKKFGYGAGNVNGLPEHKAKYFIKKSCPYIRRAFWTQRKGRKNEVIGKLYLWTDMEKHLRKDCPDFMREAIYAMANFQRWIFESGNPQKIIKKMIKEREIVK